MPHCSECERLFKAFRAAAEPQQLEINMHGQRDRSIFDPDRLGCGSDHCAHRLLPCYDQRDDSPQWRRKSFSKRTACCRLAAVDLLVPNPFATEPLGQPPALAAAGFSLTSCPWSWRWASVPCVHLESSNTGPIRLFMDFNPDSGITRSPVNSTLDSTRMASNNAALRELRRFRRGARIPPTHGTRGADARRFGPRSGPSEGRWHYRTNTDHTLPERARRAASARSNSS
jgi:hypothetical protein